MRHDDEEPLFTLPDEDTRKGRIARRCILAVALFFVVSTVMGFVFHLSRLVDPVSYW